MGNRLKKSLSCRGVSSIWLSKARRFCLLVLTACIVAACGFTPIYKMNNGPTVLRALTIETQTDKYREGDAIRAIIEGRISERDNARFELSLTGNTQTRKLQVDAEGRAQRVEIIVSVAARLINRQTGETIGWQTEERQTIAYGASGADQLRDEEDAVGLAAEQLAERLLLTAARHISKANNVSAGTPDGVSDR